jgi:hypothetical protein
MRRTLHRCAQTIKRHLAAIRNLHIINNFPDPAAHSLRISLVRRALSKQPAPLPLRLPVRAATIHSIFARLDEDASNVLFKAAVSIAFFGFLRISEFSHGTQPQSCLPNEGVDIDNANRCVILILRRTKTDTENKGVTIRIYPTGNEICPVRHLARYLAIRPPSIPLAALFLHSNGAPMPSSWFRRKLKLECEATGLLGNVNTHSLRIGAASEAAEKGIPDATIMKLGRWKSFAFTRYLRLGDRYLSNIALQLAS